MIKFTGKYKNNRKLVGFGLSENNIRALKEDKPIHLFGEEVGISGTDFIILYGKTEEDIEEALITPQDSR